MEGSIAGARPPAPLVAVVGPTASGKSALALELARRFGGEIVNCDSMQVYRGLDIGTAKPDRGTRAEIPHHLLDVAAVGEVFSAGRFEKLARQALDEIRGRGRLPVVAGGTGFYFHALFYGIFEGPARDESLRRRFDAIAKRSGVAALHRMLRRFDPESARRITPLDFPRLARALEVLRLTGKPMSEHFGSGEKPLEGFRALPFLLAPPRPALRERIDQRTLAMLQAGWVEEVRDLLAAGARPEAKGLDAIGYRQIADHLEGRVPWLAMAESIQAATRQYAKRQMTWFRKEQGLTVLAGFGDDPAIQAEAFRLTGDFLAGHVP